MPVYDATALPRLMVCGGSKFMPGFTTPGMTPTDDQLQGDAAHWLASELLTGNCEDANLWIDRKAPNGVYVSSDMVDSVTWYVDQLRSRPRERQYVETPFSFDYLDLRINARPDFIADDLADYGRRIYIDDFKYGFRIVEPEDNWQLIGYAITYIATRRVDADTVFELRIHQPRPWHPKGRSRVWIVSASHLFELRNKLIMQLIGGTNELVTSDLCTHCPAASNCPALRQVAMTFLDLSEQAIPDTMTVDEMSFMYDVLTVGQHRLNDYAAAIKERIVHSIQTGTAVRNYTMRPTTGALDWKPGFDPVAVMKLLAPGKQVAKVKPITPKQAMKFIPEKMLDGMIERKPGGVTLARIDAQLAAQALAENMLGDN